MVSSYLLEHYIKKGAKMEIIGYILDIAEVIIILGLIFQVNTLQKRVKELEAKLK